MAHGCGRACDAQSTAPDDIDQLKQQISLLTQHNHQLQTDLAERDQDLAAARAANRELMARLNTRS